LSLLTSAITPSVYLKWWSRASSIMSGLYDEKNAELF
jgi:hypothetical protein